MLYVIPSYDVQFGYNGQTIMMRVLDTHLIAVLETLKANSASPVSFVLRPLPGATTSTASGGTVSA